MVSDYVRILEQRLGVELDVVFGIPFNEALAQGRDGKIDLFPCLANTPERAEFLTFTEPYLDYPLVIITRQDAPLMGGLEDLDGKRLATGWFQWCLRIRDLWTGHRSEPSGGRCHQRESRAPA